jgi:membrane protein YdbS with pleckstrin-like domain
MTKKKGSETGTEQWGLGTIIFVIFSYVLFAVVLVGLVQYFTARYNLLTFQTLELVTGIGLVGGFVFLAGFREDISDKLRRKLKGIGSLYLFSTISFVVFGLYQAAYQASLLSKGTGAELAKIIYHLTFYIGAIGFVFAVLWTLWLIPDLLRTK